MNATAIPRSERIAWHNRGFFDGHYTDKKLPPADPTARAAYLSGHRTGRRERLKLEASK